MSYFAPPVELHGDTDQQISDIYTYLFKLASQLNLRFEETTPAAIFAEVNKALEHADSGQETNQAIRDNYQQLKTLIIKTADYTSGYGNSSVEEYAGMFVAKSEFGEYKEETAATIETNSTGITQMYEYAATLGFYADSDIDWTEYTTWQQAYIKSGLLYYDGATAKYGVAVGDVQTVTTLDDQTVVDRSNLVATFTADELAFWKGGSFANPNKVAYLSGDTMYFPKAEITGGSIKIGSSYSATVNNQSVTLWPFYVDSDGNLNANSATIKGQLTAESGSKLGNWYINTAIYNGKTSISDTSHAGIYIGTDGLYLGDADSTLESFVKLLPNGTLNANSATISGELHAGSGSTIADWTVGKTTGTNPVSYIYSGSRSTYSSTASGIYIGTDGISMGSPTSTSSGSVGVQISSSGALTCRGATITGEITAGSGNIGGWTIGASAIYTNGKSSYSSATQGLCLSTSGIGIRGSTNYCTISSTGKLECTNAKITGDITATSLDVTDATITGLTVTGSMISGSISASKIGTGTLTATGITVSGVLTVGSYGYLGGFTGSTQTHQTAGVGMYSSAGTVAATSAGATLKTSAGEVFVDSSGMGMKVIGTVEPYEILLRLFQPTSTSSGYIAFYPATDGSIALGTSTKKWGDTYCRNAAWTGSDRNEKTDISYNMDDYLAVFDRLQPVTYKRIDGESGRTHVGFIAQDVEQAILDSGMTTMDYACVAKYLKEDGEEYGYALRYEEFIALAVLKIKKLEARIAALEGA